MKTFNLSLKFFYYICYFIFFITFLDIATNIIQFNEVVTHFFKITVEKNLPTLFSTLQLILSGILLSYIAKRHREQHLDLARYWKVLMIIFYVLAIDEWFSIHDVLGSFVSDYLGGFGEVFGWTAFYIVLMSVFFFWSIRFLLNIPKKYAAYFIVSGFLFVLGAIGFELLNASGFQAYLNLSFSHSYTYIFGLIEEFLEMISIFIFNLSLFNYIQTTYKVDSIKLNRRFWAVVLVFGFLDIIGTYIVRF